MFGSRVAYRGIIEAVEASASASASASAAVDTPATEAAMDNIVTRQKASQITAWLQRQRCRCRCAAIVVIVHQF